MREPTDTRPAPPKIEFRVAAERSRDAFDIWRSALVDMFDVTLVGDDPAATFRGSVTGFHLGDALMFNNESTAQSLVRTKALARRSGIDLVMIQHQTSGRLLGDYDARAVDLSAGGVNFLDFARPTASTESDFSRITLLVPRERLPAPFRDRSLHGIVLDGRHAPAQLLGRYMRALSRTAQTLPMERAKVAVDAAFALAENAWNASAIDTEQLDILAPIMRRMVQSYIDNRLSRRELTPSAVAAAVGLSRTALYRLFEADGGVRKFILGRRLDRCFFAFLDARKRRFSIADIAYEHGFHSDAHFSRAFRRRFGIYARDARGMALERPEVATGQSDPSAEATMRNWMRMLGVEASTAP